MGPLPGLLVGLQTVAGVFQQRGHGARTHRMVLARQFGRQRRRALTGPPQGRSAGSPRVTGSTNVVSAASNAGSVVVIGRRPPPARRIRPAATARAFAGRANSLRPAKMVGRDEPVARATRLTPPQPASRASTAAHWRRRRSSISHTKARYLRRMRATALASRTPWLSQNTHGVVQAETVNVIVARTLS